LFHQFPVAAVVVGVVVTVGEVVVVLVVVEVVVVLVVVVGVVEDVVGDLAQDAKTRDVTNRKVNAIQITPFFISTSLTQLFKDSSS
jgi:hypothetical protein